MPTNAEGSGDAFNLRTERDALVMRAEKAEADRNVHYLESQLLRADHALIAVRVKELEAEVAQLRVLACRCGGDEWCGMECWT